MADDLALTVISKLIDVGVVEFQDRTQEAAHQAAVFAALKQLLDGQAQILTLLNHIAEMEKAIMTSEEQAVKALSDIDVATTATATSVAAIQVLDQNVSDEVVALQAALKALPAPGVSQAILDQAQAIVLKSQAAANASAAIIPVLQGIASNGVINPVPLPVPAPVAAPAAFAP